MGRLWKLGEEVIPGYLSLFSLSGSKEVDSGGYCSGWGLRESRLFILPAGMLRTRLGEVVEVKRSGTEGEAGSPVLRLGRDPWAFLDAPSGRPIRVLSVTRGKVV